MIDIVYAQSNSMVRCVIYTNTIYVRHPMIAIGLAKLLSLKYKSQLFWKYLSFIIRQNKLENVRERERERRSVTHSRDISQTNLSETWQWVSLHCPCECPSIRTQFSPECPSGCPCLQLVTTKLCCVEEYIHWFSTMTSLIPIQ